MTGIAKIVQSVLDMKTMNGGEIGYLILSIMPRIMTIEDQVDPRHTVIKSLWNFIVSCTFM